MKHLLIVGGTQGIGAATARAFAAYGGSVTIAGRNAQMGSTIVDELKSIAKDNERQRMDYVKLDITDIRSVKAFCKRFSALDCLLITAGGLNYGPRRETAEGVEVTFAQNVLGRFVLAKELMPLLAVNNGRVVNCLGAGTTTAINQQDWQLKANFSFINAALQYGAMSDVLALEFASRFPQVKYFHYFPGSVATDSVKNQNFPWIIQKLASVALPWVATPPDKVAAVLLKILTADEFADKQCLLDPRGKQIKPSAFIEKGGEQLRKDVWNYCLSISNQITA